MTHVEHLVHLFPVGAALIVDGAEKRWHREHVVLYHLTVVAHKVEHLCLCAAGAVYHSVNLWAKLVKQTLHHRSIGACGGEHKLACGYRASLNLVGEFVAAAVDQFLRHGVVVALRIFFGKILAEHIMACRCESVAAHAAVVFCLVGCLTAARQAHNHVAGTYVCIVNHVAALHAAGHGRVDNDGAHEVAHVGCLASCGVDSDTHVAHLLEQLVGAVDDG